MNDYGQRWRIAIDADADGAYTLADLGRWLEYIFFAPGDALIYVLSHIPGAAGYFQLTPEWYGGWAAGVASFVVWFLVLWSFDQRKGAG